MARRYPQQPVPAVAAMLVADGRVLLALRRNPPHANEWAMPGGMQELGETAAEAVRREVREETGLTISAPRLIDVGDLLSRDADGRLEYHYVIQYFAATPGPGVPAARDDISEVRWQTPDEARRLGVEARIIELMEMALNARGRR